MSPLPEVLLPGPRTRSAAVIRLARGIRLGRLFSRLYRTRPRRERPDCKRAPIHGPKRLADGLS